jgi:hypothetical protein
VTKYTTAEIAAHVSELDTHSEVSTTVVAASWHEPLNGGSGAHRITCSDGTSYATKFPGTPHHDWILGREYAFGALAAVFDETIALPVRAIAMSAAFISSAPPTVTYAITGSTAVGTSWVTSAWDSKLAGGTITMTSYPPAMWASIMVFQTWTGAEDPAALATGTSLFSVDHAWYMQPSTLTGNGPANAVCVASLSPSVVAEYARPALPAAISRLQSLPDEDVFRSFAGLPDSWWSYGVRERAEIALQLIDRRPRVAEWIASV